MHRKKLAATVAALFIGITMTFGSAGAAVAAPVKAQSDRPLPPKCNPQYGTPAKDCLILY